MNDGICIIEGSIGNKFYFKYVLLEGGYRIDSCGKRIIVKILVIIKKIIVYWFIGKVNLCRGVNNFFFIYWVIKSCCRIVLYIDCSRGNIWVVCVYFFKI